MKAEVQDKNDIDFAIENSRELGTELKIKLAEAGCFAPAPLQHIFHMLWVIALYMGGYIVLLFQPATGVKIIALLSVAFSSVQAGFIAHEAGHGAITNKRWLRKLIGLFFNTYLTALCYSHFRKIHTSHHGHCNEQDKDIDMHSGLFSLHPQAVSDKSTWFGKFVSRYQAYLIWPLVSLQGFSLKIDSINTLRQNTKATRLDQFVLLLHLLLWFGLPVYLLGAASATLNYFFITWFIGPYLGAVFLVNHIGTRVIAPDEKIPAFFRNLATTRNLGGSRIESFIWGGMNSHIEHHLFPSIPTTRLSQARVAVKKFCKLHKLPYRERSWFEGICEVFSYLKQISRLESRRSKDLDTSDDMLPRTRSKIFPI